MSPSALSAKFHCPLPFLASRQTRNSSALWGILSLQSSVLTASWLLPVVFLDLAVFFPERNTAKFESWRGLDHQWSKFRHSHWYRGFKLLCAHFKTHTSAMMYEKVSYLNSKLKKGVNMYQFSPEIKSQEMESSECLVDEFIVVRIWRQTVCISKWLSRTVCKRQEHLILTCNQLDFQNKNSVKESPWSFGEQNAKTTR